MKIAHWKGYEKKFVIDEVAKPEPGKGEILIKVKSCAVSGTDLYRYNQQKQINIIPYKIDETPGHEISGIVEEISPGVKNLKAGDRVVVQPFWGCGKCYYCKKGHENSCNQIHAVGFNSPGGLSEYIKAKSSFAFKIPDGISFDEATLTHHTAVVYYSLKVSGMKFNSKSTGAIFGIGNLGLLMVQVMKHLGIKDFFIIDINQSRLDLAQELTGGKAINPTTFEDPVKSILDATENIGVDFSVELAGGNAPTLEPAIKVIKKGGVFIAVGVRDPSDTLNLREIMRRDLRIQGSTAHTRTEMKESLGMLQIGAINAKRLITHTFPLEKINYAFETRLKDPAAISVIVNP
ncbi:MAG: hypothetical protein A2042_05210 [Candidatus Schekmanbacteria bacterium GWA2_38_11]|uniref:Enoyl reductase (ER) domain-containing protein n=2 Tax=Bacteria candidate phyla TaxID=1783234 RepID=A0A1F7RMS7_9BACT|nr:MAG: (R,R)-butanediol dehydrogenase [Candidatus Gottesmanbacteria bacterium GW2011_GWC2_39_8]OGL42876.1 MAG: hypothetical protein A2042_05210 [Candidatus Schekmanbacteria bacterium GWA2_38_11]